MTNAPDISKEAVERLVTRLGKDVFYGEERILKMSWHNPMHLDAISILRAQAARIAELEARQYALAYVIAGGEDAPGLLDSIPTDDLCKMQRDYGINQLDEMDAAANFAREHGIKEAADKVREWQAFTKHTQEPIAEEMAQDVLALIAKDTP